MYLWIFLAVAGAALLLAAQTLGGDTRVEMPAGARPPGSDAIEAALLSGRKIEAIKLYRAQHHVGLKEAKDAVEELNRTLSRM